MGGNYSYAGPSRGRDDPEEVIVVGEDDDMGEIEHRRTHDPTHLLIIWSGNEHSSHRTWITASKDSRVDLEDIE